MRSPDRPAYAKKRPRNSTAPRPAGVWPGDDRSDRDQVRSGETGKENLDFPLGRLFGVRGMDQIFPNDGAEIATDGTGRRGDRIGRAGQRPDALDHALTLDDQRHGRPGGHEFDQGLVEGLADMLGVVLLQQLTAQPAQLQGGDRPARFLLDPAENLAHQSASYGVGLEKDERALAHGAGSFGKWACG